MSQSKNDKARSSKPGRSSASSLTDAVVAALAQVEARDSKSTALKPESSSTPPTDGAGKAAPAPLNAAPTPAEAPIAAVTPPAVVVLDAPRADATIVDPPREDVAPTADAPAATPAEAQASVPPTSDPVITTEQSGDTSSGEGNVEAGSSPTRPHAAVKIEQVVPREGTIAVGLGARYFGRTDVGLVREHNEDNFLVADFTANRRGVESAILDTKIQKRGCIFAVCDGMGGAAAGEVASQMAVDTVFEVMESGGEPKDRDDFARRLVRSIEEAGSRIFAAAKMDRTRRGMGTTSTVAGLIDSTLFVGQVGDSRAYVLRGDQFALITKDQSLVNQLIEAGQLTEEEAEAFEHSNIILQALGTTEEVTVDLTFLELRRGDRLLLCSDGLSGLVHADMMKEVLQGSRDLVDAAAQLISMANAGGGHDNITVVLADFDGTDLKESGADARVAYQQYPLPPAPVEEPRSTPRATQIKSGGPKPGADVKKMTSLNPRAPRPAANSDGGSPLIWIGLTVVFILILAGVAWAISSGETPPEPVGTLPTTPRAPAPTPVVPAEGRLRIATDVVDGELWINDTRHGALRDGMSLGLEPGAYHLEARAGDARVAEATLTLGAGETHDVLLSMPTLAADELAPPEVEVARSELRADEEPLALEAEALEVEALEVETEPTPAPGAPPAPAPTE